jgi:O-antigen/teichoic acid export membrane protein
MFITSLTNKIKSINIPRSLHSLGTNLILLPLNILGSIIIARSIGPGEKGNLDLIVATATLLVMVLSFSLQAGATFIVARGGVNMRLLALKLLMFAVLQGLGASVLLAGLRILGRSSLLIPDKIGNWVIAGVAVFVCCEMLGNYLRAMLNGKQQIVKVNKAELVGRFSQVVFLFMMAGALYATGKRVFVAALFGLSIGVTILIDLLLIKSLYPYLRQSIGTSSVVPLITFAIPAYFANLTQFLNYRLDVFIVGHFAGSASVGRYTLAVSLAQLLWLLSNAAASVLLPKIAADNSPENAQHTARVTRLTLMASLASGIALAVFANYALPLLYGEAFRPSVAALLYLLPGVVVFSIANVLASYLAGIGKPQLNLLVSFSSLFFTVTLDLILIPKMDFLGAALTSTVSYSWAAFLITWLFVRETKLPVRNLLLPTMDDVRLLGSIFEPFLRHVRPQQAG